MKKIKNFFILFILTFLLTGCVKLNVNMDIKKDKSSIRRRTSKKIKRKRIHSY